jgi:DNA polymerase-4
MIPRIAHIDLTAFFVSVERILNPDLIGKPILVAGRQESRGVVTCASYEVRPYGIHAGMATSLAMKKCPVAIRVDMHPEAYEDYSLKVRDFLVRYAPVLEPASIDEFYIDWTGCEKLFGGDIRRFARKIQRNILKRFGLPCALGIASNKVTAKIVCDLAKPNGVFEVPAGDEEAFLSPLPVGVLPGVGAVMLEKLNLRGIHTCGQLAGFASDYIGQSLGKWGLTLQEYARGLGPQRLTVVREQKQISTEETFATDTRDTSFLRATLHPMSLKVSEELRSLDMKARCIHLKLRYADWVDVTRQTTRDPTNDPAIVYETALALLKKADTRRVNIRLIGVGVSKFTDDSSPIQLFRQNEEKKEWLLKTVDKINHKYDGTLVKIGCGI